MIWSGFVNIRKHSDRSFLQVIVGSKMISPWDLRAASLLWFRFLVRERLSWLSPVWMGFNFGAILSILICASTAHAWGFLQPFCLSLMQSRHMHCGPLRCVRSLCVSHSLADIWIRSVSLVVSCVFSRHFDSTFIIGRGFAALWYHAGNRDLSCGVSLIAVMRRRRGSMRGYAHSKDLETGVRRSRAMDHRADGVTTRVLQPPLRLIPSFRWPCAFSARSDRPETRQECQAQVI